MSATVSSQGIVPVAAAAPSQLRIYALESWTECLKVLRLPAYVIPTVTFPAMFYALFGLSLLPSRSLGATSMAEYLIATYGSFGVMGAALFALGVGVATERGQGWLLLKRATPMPPLAYFTAKMVMSLIFGALIVSLLAALGMLFGGVRFSPSEWMVLAITLITGAVPFCAFGLAIGYSPGRTRRHPS